MVPFLFHGLSVGSEASSITPLSEARETLKLPNYTASERQLLARQALFFLRELYVHRELKIQHFGAGVDPLPRLEKIRTEARELTNEELHEQISRVFLDLHDLHTNYLAPAPLKCASAFIPIRFQSVKGRDERLLLASQKVKFKSELVEGIAVGDQLLEVDGMPAEEAVASLSPYSGGANPDAERTRSVQMLSMRSLAMQPVPKQDLVTLKLKGTAGSYTKEVPWQIMMSEECLHEGNDRRIPYVDRMDLAIDPYQRDFNRIFGPDHAITRWAPIAGAEEVSEVFDSALLKTPAGPLGYIRLKQFYWASPGLDQGTVVDAFRRTVEESLKEAVGIVVDIRGNPGGLITLAEKLVQLFSPSAIEPTTVRMLANSMNREIFIKANGEENRWSESVKTAMAEGKAFAGPLAITPVSEANDMGQVWFRPVVVLTDANCYSACDLFAAEMKDSGAGVLIGLNASTGGGGANVMEYNTFHALFADGGENPFLPLPHRQNMRVSWRQVIRSGKGSGKLIEDAGVESDFVVPLVPADIGAESKEMMRTLHRIIDKLSPQFQSSLGERRGGLVLLKNGSTAKWIENVQGVDALELLIEGKTVASFNVPWSATPASVEVSVQGLSDEWADRPILILGKRNRDIVFRVVREVKWRGEYLPIPKEGVKLDFSDGVLPWVHPVLLHGPKDSGWQTVDGKLRVGKGPKYAGSIHTRAFLPIEMDGEGARLTFDLSLEAEDPYDSLRLYLVNPDSGERVPLFAGSHVPAAHGATITLPLGWRRAEVVFEFESDENWNLTGPVLDKFQLNRLTGN